MKRHSDEPVGLGLASSSQPVPQPATKKPRLEDESTKDSANTAPSEDPQAGAGKEDKKKAKKAKKTNTKAFVSRFAFVSGAGAVRSLPRIQIESLPTFAFDGNDLKSRREPIGISVRPEYCAHPLSLANLRTGYRICGTWCSPSCWAPHHRDGWL